MKPKEAVGYVAVGMVLAVVVVWIFQQIQPPPQKQRGGSHTESGDDQPVVMAGGSMYFSTTGDGEFDNTSTDAVTHSASSRYITKVTITDPDDKDTIQSFSGVQVKITMVYDKNKGSGSDMEKITLATDGNGQGMTLTSDKKGFGSMFKKFGPNLGMYQRKHKSLSRICINDDTCNTGSGTDCGNYGECVMTIKYCTTKNCK